jgi:Spy/CpxP family protein refolding chaperone
MRLSPVLILVAILLTSLGGAVGGWAGVQSGLHKVRPEPSLDEVLHHRLGLTPDQNTRIEALEQDFAGQRRAMEAEMEAANRDLARAVTSEHTYGPDAQQAIGRFHAAMGALQEATIRHIMAMRAVLTPDQAVLFDQTVSQTLAPATK